MLKTRLKLADRKQMISEVMGYRQIDFNEFRDKVLYWIGTALTDAGEERFKDELNLLENRMRSIDWTILDILTARNLEEAKFKTDGFHLDAGK
jgi:hypothetical protein